MAARLISPPLPDHHQNQQRQKTKNLIFKTKKMHNKRVRRYPAVSPQNKLINTADGFGNVGLKKQQGTTRVLFDTLPIDGATKNFLFFENVQSRAFPLTNITENKLLVGEGMVIERAYFTLLTFDDATGDLLLTELPDSDLNFGSGEYSIEQANQIIMKSIPTLSMVPSFNKTAFFDANYNFRFDTKLTLQPLLEFKVNNRYGGNLLAAPNAGETKYLRLTLEGAGAIIAPRQVF